MLTVKPQSLSCLSRPVPGPGGSTTLVVTVMAGFDMQGVQPRLCSDQTLWKELAGVLPAKTAPDLGFAKPRAEWLAFGRVYPATLNAVSAQARVLVQRQQQTLFDKRLHVSGARRWLSRAGFAWPSEPEPLAGPVRLDWASAYGGAGHGLNPAGQGRYRDHWVGQPLPQIEYADALVGSPDDAPNPAGFGPIPLDAPGRFKPFGTYDAQWKKDDYPALPKDSSPDALMVASRDQQFEGLFLPGDMFTCEGMTADGQGRRWVLPDWQARCFIRRSIDGNELQPVAMRLDTVFMIPHAGVLGLMWRGQIAIAETDAHDVKLLYAALEDASYPKPLTHYVDHLALLSGSQQDAALVMLDESPLLPAGQYGSILPAIPPAAKARMLDAQRAVQAAKSQAKQEASRGFEQVATPEPSMSSGDEATQIAEQLVAELGATNPDSKKLALLVKRARELGLEARQASIKKIEDMSAAHGVDIKAKAAEKLKDLTAGPPSRRTPALRKAIQEGLRQGAIDETRASRLEENLQKTVAAAEMRYRQSAHWMPEPAALADPKQMGEKIAALARQGALAHLAPGSDWVGADLSGQHLDGVDFSFAFLDGANFAGASLIGAKLSRATLARANFTDANLTGADLSGANLGRANLSGARLDHAVLSRAVLDYALLDGASFRHAQLPQATLIGVNIGVADFSEANLNECKLLGLKLDSEKDPAALLKGPVPDLAAILDPIDLSGMNATGATFHKAALLGCKAEAAKFSRADFLNATLAHCTLPRSDFTQANFSSTSIVLGSSLARSNFQQANMQACFLREVDLQSSDFRGANLAKSYFGLAAMTNVNAVGVKAAGARFERTDLRQATFASAQLTGALFMGAQLAGVSFEDARLTLADFTKAECDGQTSFFNAKTNQAKMPRSASD